MSIRSELLTLLEKNKSHPMSGQEMADMLKVSRNAVCKMIHTLKDEGYQIHSIPRVGYQLDSSCDILSAEAIRCYLDQDIPIHIYRSVDSTNQVLKKMAIDGVESFSLVVAEEQTAGRGRFQRSFYSPAQTGIYMSFLLRNLKHQDASMLTIYIAVAIHRVLKEKYQISTQIKWINDILYNNKKVCGILCETISDVESGQIDAMIIGIGVNVSTIEFPNELADIATSLSNTSINRNACIAYIINEFIRLKEEDPSIIIEEYRKASSVLHKSIQWTRQGKLYTGYVENINDEGNLIVNCEGNRMTLCSGEVSMHIEKES